MKSRKISVHIADDHKIIIDGIVAVLDDEDDIKVVGYSCNGNDLINWFKEGNKCDVLILDINMPEISGMEVLKFLKQKNIFQPTVVLSSYDDIKLIKEVIKLGAKGFIAKKCAGLHISNAIRAVVHDDEYFGPSIQELIVKNFASKTGINGKNKNQDGILINSLTNREVQVLKLIAQQNSTKEIADELFISSNTVETHRKNLIKKLNVKNVVGLALYAAKNNLV
ncbi:MAG: response regulator transcription factor [Flavobacteriaceae bacterium]|nr:response regulator transcription factor [Flavobacteriaceae bacterium]